MTHSLYTKFDIQRPTVRLIIDQVGQCGKYTLTLGATLQFPSVVVTKESMMERETEGNKNSPRSPGSWVTTKL